EPRTNKQVVKDAPFTAVVTRSIVLLKEVPVKPRLADYRVAVFNTGKYLFGEKEQASKTIYYANRWNIEPKDLQAWKEGKLVEPKNQIIFYVDNNFPEKWIPYIKESIEQWNELFEQIGFKNVIKAVDFPLDDPEFDPDNIKYSCVRYAPIGIENAMGPSWVDPRSGEIINASVYVYHDIIKLLNNWMFVQISPANKDLQTKNIPEGILGDGIRYVVSHEVGHCLGFMHNMSASSVIPVDSLRSPTFTNKTGTTTSIMDYARFNYVAQPGDKERGVKLTPPRFGEYDKFLIKWNYTYYPNAKNPQEEADTLSNMVSKAIKDPIYRYGIQLSYPLDPRSQTEDLGDDAIKASEYGIKNLQYLINHLNGWVGADDEDFSYRGEIYDGIVYQYIRYINHIFANVGGIYLNQVKVSDKMVPFESVEREKQKRSLEFIMNQINNLDWLENEELMKNLTVMGSAKNLLQTVLAKAVIASPSKVVLSSMVSKNPYDFFECSDDVFNFVWQSSIKRKNLTKIERFMQTEYLNTVMNSGNISKLITGSGISEINNTSLFEILKQEDSQERFSKQMRTENAMEYQPVSANGVPSTKFAIVFNTESNYYKYVIKVKKLLESLKHARVSKEDKLHYELLLKKINSALKVD
ncbi:MAG: zinc-dependent metalloprotease, partial [Thiovulaceae bacterium]|nr:zinc-dependent metalloprotease [Sulfurimonadaceae bacterium]